MGNWFYENNVSFLKIKNTKRWWHKSKCLIFWLKNITQLSPQSKASYLFRNIDALSNTSRKKDSCFLVKSICYEIQTHNLKIN